MVTIHSAKVHWRRQGAPNDENLYPTAHTWNFDGGARIEASSSPHVMPAPYSVAENVDPEEALVAAASSCHMMFFLFFAQRSGFRVESYEDDAEGFLGWTEDRRKGLTRITLRPRVTYGDNPADAKTESDLHERAHKACFIANTLRCPIKMQPRRHGSGEPNKRSNAG